MLSKREKILDAALRLFASEGYASTPTKKIARWAGVSEGLIFRHFKNKQGLLNAIMEVAEKKLGEIYAPLFMETDPVKVILKTIEAPFNIEEDEHDYWRLQFMLKWQKAYNNPRKMDPVIGKLTAAFDALKYNNPEMESRFLIYSLEAISAEVLKGNLTRLEAEQYKYLLLTKYRF